MDMETICAVVGCNSKWTETTDLEFFRVTTNKNLLPLWQKVVKLNIAHGARICSLHFKEEDVVERGGEKRLKLKVVPSYNIVERNLEKRVDNAGSDDTDDDTDNLAKVRKTLYGKQKTVKPPPPRPTSPTVVKLPRRNLDIIQIDYSGGKTRSIGTQVCLKTQNEVLLKKAMKTLKQRIKRREEKVTYLQTVFKMIKKNVEGTDIANKLFNEIENISNNFHADEYNSNRVKKIKIESPIKDEDSDDEMNSEQIPENDKGSFVEVALSPNLKRVSNVRRVRRVL